MSATIPRAALALAIAFSSLGTAGCGLLLDGAYAVSSKRYEETVQERKPTGQIHTAIEYEGSVAPDGVVHLTCQDRDRRVERSSSVHKTFRYRGSYDSELYLGTAVLSGVVGAAVTGVFAALCTQKPQDPMADQLSCLNMLYATPFAADVGWSLMRAATAEPAKLIAKHTSEPVLAFSEKPIREAAVPCDSVQLVLGAAVGPEPSPADILNGTADQNRPHLLDGAIAVPLAPDGTASLKSQPEAATAWLDNATFRLWAVDAEGVLHGLNVDRCTTLRPLSMELAPEARTRLLQACPPPKAAVQRP